MDASKKILLYLEDKRRPFRRMWISFLDSKLYIEQLTDVSQRNVVEPGFSHLVLAKAMANGCDGAR
jgi:hypothetical protein